MVRHREIEAESLRDGADQALGPAQRQAEHGTERQGRRDRQAGVARLTAPAGTGLRLPGLECLGRKPDSQATPGAQARIVGYPVGDPVRLLGKVAAPVPARRPKDR